MTRKSFKDEHMSFVNFRCPECHKDMRNYMTFELIPSVSSVTVWSECQWCGEEFVEVYTAKNDQIIMEHDITKIEE